MIFPIITSVFPFPDHFVGSFAFSLATFDLGTGNQVFKKAILTTYHLGTRFQRAVVRIY